MKYVHKNMGNGEIGVTSDDGKDVVLLKPGEEITLSRKSEGNGIVIIETIKEEKKKKTGDKFDGIN